MVDIKQISGLQMAGGWKNTLVRPHCMQLFPRAPWLASGGVGNVVPAGYLVIPY